MQTMQIGLDCLLATIIIQSMMLSIPCQPYAKIAKSPDLNSRLFVHFS